jgi:hypothetical protein
VLGLGLGLRLIDFLFFLGHLLQEADSSALYADPRELISLAAAAAAADWSKNIDPKESQQSGPIQSWECDSWIQRTRIILPWNLSPG